MKKKILRILAEESLVVVVSDMCVLVSAKEKGRGTVEGEGGCFP